MTFAQVAEEYYGENGTQPTASATISLLSALGENNTIKAGDTIMISIEYILAAAALYNYGEQVQPLFDTYDGTEIVLYLPDGLSVVSKDEAGDTLQGVTLKAPEKGENNWTFSLNNTAITASSDTVGSFQVAIRVEDNGALATNHIFDFKEGADLMEISTSITIKDRTDPNDVKDGVTYEDITSRLRVPSRILNPLQMTNGILQRARQEHLQLMRIRMRSHFPIFLQWAFWVR